MSQSRDFYLEAAMMPDYIKNEKMAKEAVKAVLGILASRLEEDDAREFIDQLPEYLTYKNLRGHQERPTTATPEDCLELVKDKMKISNEQAQELMLKIISAVDTENKGKPGNIANRLTTEWRNVFQAV